MIGKLKCWFLKKHKRGKLVDRVEVEPGVHINTYRCPRCGGTHTRRTRAGS